MLQQVITAAGSLWNLILVLLVAVVLGGFVYSLFLKRLLRARRIANLRERRLLREAAERK
jgi:Tfp pilus assembly protein PilX